jgi:hypothetical protein
MSMSIGELETQVLQLDLESRAALAEKLLQSLENLSETENEQLWLAEAQRRRQEALSGQVQLRDGEAVLLKAAMELQ